MGTPVGHTSLIERSLRLTDRLLVPASSERFARIALAASTLVYAVLILWLTRGASFTYEEITYFATSREFGLGAILEPYESGGHLIAVTRLLFDTSLRVFGAEHLPFQLVVIALAATTSWLLFAIVKRRVGPLPALAAAVIVLFLGTTPEVIHGWTTMWLQACAAGLGALLALDRRSRPADVAASLLLVIAVFSFSIGVAFAIAAAALILARGDRARLWVAIVPLGLFAAWWVWALKFDGGGQSAVNALLTPTWAADSLAAACASLSGLGIDLTGSPNLWNIDLGWGRIVAVAAIVLAVVGINRRGWTPLLWGALVFLLALWFAQALAYSSETFAKRTPDLDRYAYPVAIGVLLVLAASFHGAVASRRTLLVIAGLLAFALPVNLWQLRERGAAIREESELVRARLAIVDLERDLVDPNQLVAGPEGGIVQKPAGAYLASADRFGSLGFSAAELAAASEEARGVADETSQGILGLALTPVEGGGLTCEGGSAEVVVPTGESVLRADEGGAVKLRRFADTPTVEVGALRPDQAASLTLPDDAAPQPWIASIDTGTLEVCSEDRS